VVAHWRLCLVRRPKLFAGDHPHIQRILAGLAFPAYAPPLLLSWWPLQLVANWLRNQVPRPLRPQSVRVRFLEPEVLTLADGAEVGLLWAAPLDVDAPIDEGAPLLCIFHTVVFSPEKDDIGTERFCAEAIRRGWRPVIMLRRGHIPGRPLKTPAFHVVGLASDARVQVAACRARWPSARHLAGVGHSAGTGVLVRMAGEDGEASPFVGFACNCPGYDTGPGGAFDRMTSPGLDPGMLFVIRSFFLTGKRNRAAWAAWEAEAEAAQLSAAAAGGGAAAEARVEAAAGSIGAGTQMLQPAAAAASTATPSSKGVVATACSSSSSSSSSSRSSVRPGTFLAALRGARAAESLGGLWAAVASGLSGFEGGDAAHAATNPMVTAGGISVPGLILNAEDDPVCTMAPLYVGSELFDGGCGNRVLVLTAQGSHCAFLDAPAWARRLIAGQDACEGGVARSGGSVVSWGDRRCLDFLEACVADRAARGAGGSVL